MKRCSLPKSFDTEKELGKWREKSKGTQDYGLCFVGEELQVNGGLF